MTGLLQPSASLLCKLASIAVHVDEFFSDDGHHLDRSAMLSAARDPEVVEWVEAMASASLAPRKRSKDGR